MTTLDQFTLCLDNAELDSSYRIIDDPHFGTLMVRNDEKNLSIAEINKLYEALRKAHAIQQRAYLQSIEQQLLTSARWVFPNGWEDLKESGPCVYFAVSLARPEWIKIGLTQDVFNRRKALGKGRPGTFRILAYAITDQNEALELALHFRFSDIRDGRSEFFRMEPVLEFLNQFRVGGTL